MPSVINSSIDSTGSGDIFLSMFFTFKISQKFSDYEALLGSHVAAGLHANQIGNRFQLSVNEIYKIIISILK